MHKAGFYDIQETAWNDYGMERFYAGRSKETNRLTFPTASRFRTAAISSSDCFPEMTDFELLRNFSKTSLSLIGLRGSPLATRAV